MTNPISEALHNSFKNLDHRSILAVATQRPDAIKSDRDKIAAAFAFLSAGMLSESRQQLESLSDDGTTNAADIAYIRGFLAEAEGDFERVIEELGPHLADEKATHGPRMRLRIADSCVRLEKYQLAVNALRPLMEPPGCPETLESQLVYMDIMLRNGVEQDKLIEQTTMIDMLMDRGFRLADGGNAIYYAELLDFNRIDAIIGKLLNAHEVLIEAYTPTDPDEMHFLLSAGEKYKAPCAVRAAGRGYVKAPFKWEDLEPDKVAFTFASHEQHMAAYLTVTQSFDKEEINKDQDLWGPLILSAYNARQWEDTLEIVKAHEEEIATLPMADHCATVRALCAFQLGKLEEALEGIHALGEKFYEQAEGYEATAEPLILMRLGKNDDLLDAVKRALSCAKFKEDRQYGQQYINTVLADSLVHEQQDRLKLWIKTVRNAFEGDQARDITRSMSEVSLEWSYPEVACFGADVLEEFDPSSAEYIRAAACAWAGDKEGFEAKILPLFENPGTMDSERLKMTAARWYRRLGESEKVKELIEPLAAEGQPRRHAAMALLIGMKRDLGATEQELAEDSKLIDGAIREVAKSQEMYQQFFGEAMHFFEGDQPKFAFARAQRMASIPSAGIETLRYARWTATAFDAPDELKQVAEAFIKEWKAEHLKKEHA